MDRYDIRSLRNIIHLKYDTHFLWLMSRYREPIKDKESRISTYDFPPLPKTSRVNSVS